MQVEGDGLVIRSELIFADRPQLMCEVLLAVLFNVKFYIYLCSESTKGHEICLNWCPSYIPIHQSHTSTYSCLSLYLCRVFFLPFSPPLRLQYSLLPFLPLSHTLPAPVCLPAFAPSLSLLYSQANPVPSPASSPSLSAWTHVGWRVTDKSLPIHHPSGSNKTIFSPHFCPIFHVMVLYSRYPLLFQIPLSSYWCVFSFHIVSGLIYSLVFQSLFQVPLSSDGFVYLIYIGGSCLII